MTEIDWKAVAEDVVRRLERCHDDADKYQVRALDAEKEVERLRAELAQRRADWQTLEAAGNAELERLRAEVTRLSGLKTVLELKKLRAENAELRDQESRTVALCQELQRANEAAETLLAWFEARESLFIKSTGYYASDLATWEDLNPKPCPPKPNAN